MRTKDHSITTRALPRLIPDRASQDTIKFWKLPKDFIHCFRLAERFAALRPRETANSLIGGYHLASIETLQVIIVNSLQIRATVEFTPSASYSFFIYIFVGFFFPASLTSGFFFSERNGCSLDSLKICCP